jgi:hypothetical protein
VKNTNSGGRVILKLRKISKLMNNNKGRKFCNSGTCIDKNVFFLHNPTE